MVEGVGLESHGWLVDRAGRVIDPTAANFGYRADRHYFGVPICRCLDPVQVGEGRWLNGLIVRFLNAPTREWATAAMLDGRDVDGHAGPCRGTALKRDLAPVQRGYRA